eukprot:TRINITY_DN17427_c0_g1_i1.p1 TRINITY_DN17427_c0_g1~~TRINITY_DN17427_c0_g1_i1.p1  ORF type:complete len:308 (+),score=38.44 TRINITY_DN17427_c0_g1_i1:93-1016(+)
MCIRDRVSTQSTGCSRSANAARDQHNNHARGGWISPGRGPRSHGRPTRRGPQHQSSARGPDGHDHQHRVPIHHGDHRPQPVGARRRDLRGAHGPAPCLIRQAVDCATYVFNLIAEKEAVKKRWLPHCSAVVSMVMLIGVCLYVIGSAAQRLTGSSENVSAGLMLAGGLVNIAADVISVLVLYQSKGLSDGQGLEKGRKHNMRSALVHVGADSLRAVTVTLVAIVALVNDFDLNKPDAITAIVLSGTVIGGAVYTLGRAVLSLRAGGPAGAVLKNGDAIIHVSDVGIKTPVGSAGKDDSGAEEALDRL